MLFLLLAAASLAAADFGALKPEGYVSDFARVVDVQSKAELERYCARLRETAGVEVALVTLETLEGEPIEDVANLLFRKWGVGAKGNNTGLLFLLVTRDRRSRLEVGYGLEEIIPDGYAGSVLREMRPLLREGRYGDAVVNAAHTVGSRIATWKGVTLDTGVRPRRARRQEPSVPWPLLIGGLGLLLLLIRAGRGGRGGGGGFLSGLIVGNLLSGGHSRGGGGFGGFDSGDSFGGFGGGDSGGGGASSDW